MLKTDRSRHYKIWWKYAYDRVVDLVRRRRKERSWGYMQQKLGVVKRYSWLYRRALGVLPLPPLSTDELDELSVLHDSERVNFIQMVRVLTVNKMRSEVKALLVEAAASKPTKGMMSRLFASSKTSAKITVDGMEIELSDEQLAAMKSLAQTAQAEQQEEVDELNNSPDEYVKMSLEIRMASLAVAIVQREGKGNCLCLLHASLNELTTKYSQRQQGFFVNTTIGNALIKGAYSDEHILALETSSRMAEGGSLMLEMKIDAEPPSDDHDLAIECKLLPVVFSFNHECFNAVFEWVEDVKQDMQQAEFSGMVKNKASAAASSGLDKGGEFAKLYAAPDKRVKVTMSIEAPTVVLPGLSSGIGGNDVSILVVKLGHLLVGTAQVRGGDITYKLELKDINVHLCNSADMWQTAGQYAVLTSHTSLKLEIDKPTDTRPETRLHLYVGSIDACVTKAHILHATALQDMLQVLMSSAEERASKKKLLQQSQIRRIEFELAKRNVQDKCLADNMVLENTKSMADADKIKMVVTVKVDKLSVTLAATAADAASGSIWSRTVTPQKSIKLEMNDLSVNLESKKSNYSILQACLQEITVRHFSEDSSDDVFDIIAPAKYTVGWLFLLETAKQFEKIYREFDQNGDENLTLDEITELLFKHGIRLQDSQLLKFKEQVDTDGDGNISLEEFVQLAIVLCSRSETKLKLPIPSTISNLDQNTAFISCKVQNTPSMNFTSTEVSVGRLQLQIATFPLRNAIDWMKLVTRADRKTENIKDLSESSDEVAAAIQQKQVAKPGLKVLRASFEGNSEDIFIPPKNSSELRFDMEEVDVVLHDMLMGEAALFFRAGPLSLSRSSMLPCEDGHPYLNKMQIALNRLRLLYARRKVDMDWDLENILSETKFVFKCNQSMAHDISGRTQDDTLQIEGVCDDEIRGSPQGQRIEPTVPDKEILLQLSLNQVLFMQGMQKVFEKALPENSVEVLEESSPSTEQVLKRDQSMSLRKSKTLAKQDASTVTEKKYRRNTKSLTRLFACPKLVVRLIDDLSDITEHDDLTQTPHHKLLECRISGTKITETVDHTKPDAEVNASMTIQVQTECVHDAKAMETVVEPWRFGVEAKTSIEKDTQLITVTAKERLEFSITPDHIERPRLSMQKFDLYAKKQALYMKNALSTAIAEGFKQMETSMAVDQKVTLWSMLT